MAVNKVNYGNQILIDLTGDTVTETALKKDFTAHRADGTLITGTYSPKMQSKSVTPATSAQSVTPDSGYDGLSAVSVGAIPTEYVITSDANAEVYDIYNGKIAYVNGQKVTGAYEYMGHGGDSQWNSGNSGCSASALVIPCPFEPTGVVANLNSGTYTSNRIVSADFRLNNVATYHTYRGVSGITRTQITSDVKNYISYNSSTKKLTIKSASSSYLWSANNYRILLFK